MTSHYIVPRGQERFGPFKRYGFAGIEPAPVRYRTMSLLAFVAATGYFLGRYSQRNTKSFLPPVGTLIATYAVFRALDAFWPDALSPNKQTTPVISVSPSPTSGEL